MNPGGLLFRGDHNFSGGPFSMARAMLGTDSGAIVHSPKVAYLWIRCSTEHGESFDRGETFSGVDYELALSVVDDVRPLMPEGWSLAEFTLRWILMADAVTSAIPGGGPSQVEENCRASDRPAIPESTLTRVRDLYERRVRHLVHHRW